MVRTLAEVLASCTAIGCERRRENPASPFCKRCFAVLTPELQMRIIDAMMEEPPISGSELHTKHRWLWSDAVHCIMDEMGTQGSHRSRSTKGRSFRKDSSVIS